MTRYACLFVENFSAAAHVRAEPGLSERPLVVLAGTPPTARVVEANVVARSSGIVPGLPEAEARARCPALVSRPVSEERTSGARAALLEAGSTMSPRVEDGGAGVVFVDIVGLGRLVGDDAAVGERLLRAARAVGLPATVAITDNRAAARIIARVSSRLTVVPPGEDRSSIAPVPIAALGLEAEIATVLARWGIRTVGELAALPRGGLAMRLGAPGLAAQDRALAVDREPFRAWTPPPFWEEAQGIDWEIETWAGLAPVLEAVLSRLVGRLSAAHLAADGLAIDLALVTGGRDERFVAFAHPFIDLRVMLKLVELDVAARPPSAGVIRVLVRARAVLPAPAQSGLGYRPVPTGRDLSTTLARLAALVGPEHVGSPVALDSHRPDAISLEPFVPSPREPDPARRSGRAEDLVAPLAFRRLRPPREVTVETERDEPVRLTLARAPERILARVGPWRTSGEWWDTRVFARDEWDVALADGMVCRLAHDRLTNRWYLDGAYD